MPARAKPADDHADAANPALRGSVDLQSASIDTIGQVVAGDATTTGAVSGSYNAIGQGAVVQVYQQLFRTVPYGLRAALPRFIEDYTQIFGGRDALKISCEIPFKFQTPS